jgi:hypothetical protein
MAVQRCNSVIESRPHGGHAAALSFSPKSVFGKDRAPVSVTVEGHKAFDTTIAIYGGVAFVGFRKAQLAEMGLAVGDQVALTIEPR